MKGEVRTYACDKGFLICLFQTEVDKDLIFKRGTYIFVSRGLYLNKWTLYFDPNNDVPSTIPIWVKLLRFPITYWNQECLKAIRNLFGKYIVREEPKGN